MFFENLHLSCNSEHIHLFAISWISAHVNCTYGHLKMFNSSTRRFILYFRQPSETLACVWTLRSICSGMLTYTCTVRSPNTRYQTIENLNSSVFLSKSLSEFFGWKIFHKMFIWTIRTIWVFGENSAETNRFPSNSDFWGNIFFGHFLATGPGRARPGPGEQ